MKSKFIFLFNFFIVLLIFNFAIFAMEEMADGTKRKEFLSKKKIKSSCDDVLTSEEVAKIKVLDYDGQDYDEINEEYEIDKNLLMSLKVLKNFLEDTQAMEIVLRDFEVYDNALKSNLNRESLRQLFEIIEDPKKINNYQYEKVLELFYLANFLGTREFVLRQMLRKIKEGYLSKKFLKDNEWRDIREFWKFYRLDFKNLESKRQIKLKSFVWRLEKTTVLSYDGFGLDSLSGIDENLGVDKNNVHELLLEHNNLQKLNVEKLLKVFPNLKKISAQFNKLLKVKLPHFYNGLELDLKGNTNFKIEHPILNLFSILGEGEGLRLNFSDNKKINKLNRLKLYFSFMCGYLFLIPYEFLTAHFVTEDSCERFGCLSFFLMLGTMAHFYALLFYITYYYDDVGCGYKGNYSGLVDYYHRYYGTGLPSSVDEIRNSGFFDPYDSPVLWRLEQNHILFLPKLFLSYLGFIGILRVYYNLTYYFKEVKKSIKFD